MEREKLFRNCWLLSNGKVSGYSNSTGIKISWECNPFVNPTQFKGSKCISKFFLKALLGTKGQKRTVNAFYSNGTVRKELFFPVELNEGTVGETLRRWKAMGIVSIDIMDSIAEGVKDSAKSKVYLHGGKPSYKKGVVKGSTYRKVDHQERVNMRLAKY